MKPQIIQGYPAVMLTAVAIGERRRLAVHRMVLQAFVGPCPSGMEACHYPDKSPSNCALSNLRWDTKVGNFSDKIEHGTQLMGENHPLSLLCEEEVIEIIKLTPLKLPLKQIADQFGVSISAISAIQLGKRWKHLQP